MNFRELPPLPPDERALALPAGRSLRHASGHAAWKLVPPQAQPLARALAYVPSALALTAVVGCMFAFRGGFWLWWVIGKGGVFKLGLFAGAGVGLTRVTNRMAAWHLRRLAAMHARLSTLQGRPAGAFVRLVGTVRAATAAPFASAISGRPAVLAHYESRGAAGIEQRLRGVDFFIDFPDREPVLVRVDDVYFDARPARVSGVFPDAAIVGGTGEEAHFREALLAPGDRVEALGVLADEIDKAAPGGFGRTPPLVPVLRGGTRLPLFVRVIQPRRLRAGG